MREHLETLDSELTPAARDDVTGLRSPAGEAIYQSLYDAIVSHVVPPGTKLTEEILADVFHVSRTVIRPVLQVLAGDGVVTITPRRGAHVTKPMVSEARDVFAARRIIETGILREWDGIPDPALVAGLDEHMHAERHARMVGDQKTLLRLSGDFHLKLAAISGNSLLIGVLRDLVSRSVLATAVYQRGSGASCHTDHHQILVDLIRSGERNKLIRQIAKHIQEIVDGLDFDSHEDKPIDLRSVLLAKRT